MPDIGLPEIAIIAIVVFFLFGAQRLPKLGRSLGQGISSFKKGLNGDYDDAVPDTVVSTLTAGEGDVEEPATEPSLSGSPVLALAARETPPETLEPS